MSEETQIREALDAAIARGDAPEGAYTLGGDGGACWSTVTVRYDRKLTIEERNAVYDVLQPIVDSWFDFSSTATYHLEVL